jgi:hypothetical protein
MRLLLVAAPRGYRERIDKVERLSFSRVVPKNFVRGRAYDYVQIFVRSKDRLRALLPALRQAITKCGMIWVSWPKRSSGLGTDLAESDVRNAGLAIELVDVKICAIDETWSALKFVIPTALR